MSNIPTIPNERFNLSKIRTLSPNDAKTYITNYFIPLNNGNHAFYDGSVFAVRDDKELKQSYFSRMPKELQNYYFRDYLDVRQIAFDVNKPVYYEDKINLCPRMKFTYNANYKPSEYAQEGLDFVLGYIKSILCSDKQDCYDFLLKWISNMLKGNKNNSCLYLKGVQGTGKSSLYQFLSNNVLGNALCLESGSDPIRTKFNEILSGKLLVCFEELENFSKAEWESISSTLKKMITSTNINYQNKCTKAYESNNINNYMLISNNDSVKDDDGRRYFILDISTSKVGNHSFYSQLYEYFNDDVGEAFYNYVYGLDTKHFNAQSFPMTQSKMDSLSKRLDSVYKFIKEQFILKNQPINHSAVDLYSDYKFMTAKPVAKEDFHRKLAEIGIDKTKKGQKIWYTVEHQYLLNIGKTKNWINDVDEYDDSMQHDPFEDDCSTSTNTKDCDDCYASKDDDNMSISSISSTLSDTKALINHTKKNKTKHIITFDDV